MSPQRPVYSLDEARAMLPEIRAMLLQLAVERRRYQEAHAALHERLDADGDAAQPDGLRSQEETVTTLREEMGALLELLERRGVELRDLEAGLVDIPTERDGEPAWFCWRLSDPELGFWHTTREGFASRKPL